MEPLSTPYTWNPNNLSPEIKNAKIIATITNAVVIVRRVAFVC